jgi:hypothetical protein
MGLTNVTVAEVSKYLPCSILSLGWPDNLHDHVDLSGSTLDAVDIVDHCHHERIADLSVLQNLGSYDLVLDCGTLEHCSNIAHGFINAASAVKQGGRIIHELPINMVNHGYWNVSPVWFSDFYGLNGFVIERMDRTLDAPFNESRVLDWPGNATAWYYNVFETSLTLCVARRMNSNPISLPKCQSMWLA